jgi:hypothetical protein
MAANALVRASNGRFMKGHPGGPGRPRRAVEQEYLVTLNAAVTLEAWRQIVDRAVADALKGDGKARDFLAKYLIGDNPPSLTELAAAQEAGMTVDDQIAASAGQLRLHAQMTRFRARLHALLNNNPLEFTASSSATGAQ